LVIKSLAADLYRAQQQVHRLEGKLEKAAPGERDSIGRELQAASAERDQLRRMVDARKEKPLFRTSFNEKGDRRQR